MEPFGRLAKIPTASSVWEITKARAIQSRLSLAPFQLPLGRFTLSYSIAITPFLLSAITLRDSWDWVSHRPITIPWAGAIVESKPPSEGLTILCFLQRTIMYMPSALMGKANWAWVLVQPAWLPQPLRC